MARPPSKIPPFFRADYDEEFHPAALQAMQAGTASEHQAREGMKWIIENACATYQQTFIPGDPYASAFMSGRVFAGQQILKMLRLNPRAFQKARITKESKTP
jgi:hypothetical protein